MVIDQNIFSKGSANWPFIWPILAVLVLVLFPWVWNYTHTEGIKQYRLKPENVSWVYVLDTQSVRQPYVDEPVNNLNTPWQQKSGMRQQFTYRFHSNGGLPNNYALFIPHMNGAIDLHVNGVPIFTPWKTTKTANYFTAGKVGYLPVANQLYQPGTNRLVLTSSKTVAHTAFTSIYFGPEKKLSYALAYNQKIDFLRLISGYLIVLAASIVLAWGIWVISIRYIYIGLFLSVLWVKFLTTLPIVFSSLGDWWLPVNQELVLLTLIFALRFSQKAKILAEAYWPLNILLGLAAFFSLLGGYFLSQSLTIAYIILGGLWPLITLTVLAIIAYCAGRYFRRTDTRAAVTRSTTVLLILAFLILIVGGNPYIPHFAAGSLESIFLFSTLAFSTLLLIHILYLGGNRVAEHARQRMQLSRLINSQKLQLASQSRKLEQEAQARAILQERQRLVRDMHDGIGGTLASLIVRVRGDKLSKEETEAELQQGLTDLRLIVDSLDHVGQDLDMVMHMFKDRIEPQIEASKMKLLWEYDSQLNAQAMDAESTLHVFRFLQEAVTNAMRHSGAQTIRISCLKQKTGDAIKICVEDDGIGISNTIEQNTGRGMYSLKLRARRLGGECTIERAKSAHGTVVTLSFSP